MRRILLFLILALGITARAQDAIVIHLSPQFAQRAVELHREQEELDAKWQALRIDMVHVYLEAGIEQKTGCVYEHMLVRPEWGCAEFVFSANFRFIVPAPNLTKAPFDDGVFQIINGAAVAIKEKTDYEIEREIGPDKWIWNNQPNSETNPKPE